MQILTENNSFLVKLHDAENYWMGLGEISKLPAKNVLHTDDEFFKDNPELYALYLMRQPEYISYAAWVFCGVTVPPYQSVMLRNLWSYRFPMLIGCRGAAKSFTLALFSLLKAALTYDYKIVLAGSSFRQSKFMFNYVEEIWDKSPVLQSICSASSGPRRDQDVWSFKINTSYIYAIPIGQNGDKIRGLRGNTIIVDEFAAHNARIVEEVLGGFGAVKASPVESLKDKAKEKYFIDMGLNLGEEYTSSGSKNQLIICGTADYYFNHFYDYWKRYKRIIQSRGNKEILNDIFKGKIPVGFDWKDYCVMRIPYSALPPGFMDDSVVARAKSQMSVALYQKEYEAVFVEDSDGFFKRSLIEGCVASQKNIDKYGSNWVSWCPQPFDPVVFGRSDREYIMAVDPASEQDNLAIAVMELHSDHRRLVYMWTTNRKNFDVRRKYNTTACTDYYDFVNRKIRSLMASFNIVRIAMDMQGGGYSLLESLQSKSTLEEGEVSIYPIINDNKPATTDDYPGLHIVEPLQFVQYEWVVKANWSLKTDMETRNVLLPQWDVVTTEIAIAEDKRKADLLNVEGIYDSLEDVVMEIEELKNELAMVIHQTYGSGANIRQRWIVPKLVEENFKKKINQKKDRYTALMMANYVGRNWKSQGQVMAPYVAGDTLKGRGRTLSVDDRLYMGPEWYTSQFGV